METEKMEKFPKLEFLRKLEEEAQEKWKEEKIFEMDAAQPGSSEAQKEKFFVTFPFPDMNGRLHLGHAFCLFKAEFAVGYHRLKGKRCLFPFGFHCSGTSILTCAEKLKWELETFGFPPKFPDAHEEAETAFAQQAATKEQDDPTFAKDPKEEAETTDGAERDPYQWNIMKKLGFDDDQIREFTDPAHWLEYFPQLAKEDLQSMGCKIDWRRSFITSDKNKYFDSFVKWQFWRLRDYGALARRERYTIYSPKDRQPCLDHERYTDSQGVTGIEYTLIKMKLQKPYPPKLADLADKDIFLVATTLRPETMYGQTNCWLHPDLTYIAFPIATGEVFISTHHAARNMAFQKLTAEWGKFHELAELTGKDLLGIPLKAPLSVFEKIYTLPMDTIEETKGTGIGTSVPSDEPDDLAALGDLQKNKSLRQKFNISDKMVMPFEPVPIIDVPGFGNLLAVKAPEQYKINSHDNQKKLQQAKEETYSKDFYDGVMLVGDYKGEKVQNARKKVQAAMVKSGEAVIYHEPERCVKSRSGDKCVVAKCDQWGLEYGKAEWKEQAMEVLDQMETYSEETHHKFQKAFDSLEARACARTYSLGTRMPWDDQLLIDSLSDSTIYMAYYTVAHLLQGYVVDGKQIDPANIQPEQLTPEVWDYIFFKDAPKPATNIPLETLQKLRSEFEYWYPLDLRVSGNYLVPNHLTYFIFNHVAIWPNDKRKWPKAVYASDHLLLNKKKMSKSTGNFVTIRDAVEQFSADGVRFTLAAAGDGLESPNFDETLMKWGTSRLYTRVKWTEKVLDSLDSYRSGPADLFMDQAFESMMNHLIKKADESYKKMLFRDALKYGFFQLQEAQEQYRDMANSSGDSMHRQLILRFIEMQALMLSPICPHVCEHIWELLCKPGSIVNASWPSLESLVVDNQKLASFIYLRDTIRNFGKKIEDQASSSRAGMKYLATVYIAQQYLPWQRAVLTEMKTFYVENYGSLPDNQQLKEMLSHQADCKSQIKKAMEFAQYTEEQVTHRGISAFDLKPSFDELTLLNDYIVYLKRSLKLEEVTIQLSTSADTKTQEQCLPSRPFVVFKIDEKMQDKYSIMNGNSTGSTKEVSADFTSSTMPSTLTHPVFGDEIREKDIPYLPCELIHGTIKDDVTELNLAGVCARYSSGALPVNTDIRMMVMPIEQGYSFKGVTFSSQVIVGPRRRLMKPLKLTFPLKVRGRVDVTALVSKTAANDAPEWQVIPEKFVKVIQDQDLVEVTTYEHCRHQVQAGLVVIHPLREVVFFSVHAKLLENTHKLKLLCSDDERLCKKPSEVFQLCHAPEEIITVEVINGDNITLSMVSKDESIIQTSCPFCDESVSRGLDQKIHLQVKANKQSSQKQAGRSLTAKSQCWQSGKPGRTEKPQAFFWCFQLPNGYGEGLFTAYSEHLKEVDGVSCPPNALILFPVRHPKHVAGVGDFSSNMTATGISKLHLPISDGMQSSVGEDHHAGYSASRKRKSRDGSSDEDSRPKKRKISGVAKSDVMPTDGDLLDIASDISELFHCKQLAIRLGVDHGFVATLKEETKKPQEVALEVLMKWKKMEGASGRTLHSALTTKPFNDLAMKYEEVLLAKSTE